MDYNEKARVLRTMQTRNHKAAILIALKEKRLIQNDPECPGNYLDRIVRRAKTKFYGGLDTPEACLRELTDHVVPLMNLVYTVQKETVEGVDFVTSISIHDPKIRNVEYDNVGSPLEFVFTADVTFNITDPDHGFNKLSIISLINRGRLITPLVYSAIQNEDYATFAAELEFFLEAVDPTLKFRAVVFIVDGDRGRIKAIRKFLPRARIFMCIWHKGVNFESHFGNLTLRAVEDADQVEPSEYEKLTCTVLRAKLAGEKYDAKPIFGKPLSKLNRSELLQALSEQHKDEEPGAPPTSEPNNQEETQIREQTNINNLSLTSFNGAKEVFHFLKSSRNEEEALQRIAMLAERFPGKRSYLETEVKATIKYWETF